MLFVDLVALSSESVFEPMPNLDQVEEKMLNFLQPWNIAELFLCNFQEKWVFMVIYLKLRK